MTGKPESDSGSSDVRDGVAQVSTVADTASDSGLIPVKGTNGPVLSLAARHRASGESHAPDSTGYVYLLHAIFCASIEQRYIALCWKHGYVKGDGNEPQSRRSTVY